MADMRALGARARKSVRVRVPPRPRRAPMSGWGRGSAPAPSKKWRGSPFRGCRRRNRIPERSGCGEEFSRFEVGLEAGEDHRPAAVELLVRVLAKLVVGHGEAARVADR